MKDVTSFINGTAIPQSHADFMALAKEVHRNMDLINDHLRQVLDRAVDRDGIIHDGSETKGG
jgi:hypothetical protein